VVVGGALWGSVSAGFRGAPVPAGAEWRLARFAQLVALAIANAEAWESLSRQASTDALTGIANHRTFHDRLRSEAERARRYGRDLSLVLLDVDHFKQVNDVHGHQVGDRVLAEVARRLAAEPFDVAGALTISAGVSCSDHGGEAEELVRHADRALYWAKDSGRNTTFLYTAEARDALAREGHRAERFQALTSVRALARAVDAKDRSTERHAARVAELAERLAQELGWSDERSRLLHSCGLLHDVGKIGVADALLLKPGPLTAPEHGEVERHAALSAAIAAEVLEPEQVAWIRGHHERWDGGGYPDGLAGSTIPDGAQLLALAEAWDDMTGARVYRASRTPDAALAECRRERGGQFAPAAVDALHALVARGVLAADGPR
jgi:putative nucleotidyltransferase with HDIG domain